MLLRLFIVIFTALSLTSTTATVAGAASIKGLVNYDGEKPKLREVKMDADPICVTHNSEAVYPQSIVLGENNEMGNVFVRVIKGIPKKDFPTPTEEVVVTQQGCMYHPHVIGVMVNQTLKIMNPDGTLHNVHALPKINQEFNLAMPKFRKEVTKTFDKVEFMFPMKCDVHPWMGAWIAVMPHPFFSVTEEDGMYSIDNLPPGEYEIEAWHEKLGTKTETVTITDADVELNFTFARPTKN